MSKKDSIRNKKMHFYDHMDNLSDDLHGISELLFLISEDSIGKYDVYGMLTFLGRKLEKTRKDMMREVGRLAKSDKNGA